MQRVEITGGGTLLVDTISHRVVTSESMTGGTVISCANDDVGAYVIWGDKIIICPHSLEVPLVRGKAGFQRNWNGHTLDSLTTISAMLLHELAHFVSVFPDFQGRAGNFSRFPSRVRV